MTNTNTNSRSIIGLVEELNKVPFKIPMYKEDGSLVYEAMTVTKDNVIDLLDAIVNKKPSVYGMTDDEFINNDKIINVLVGYYVDGISTVELGEKFGISPQRVSERKRKGVRLICYRMRKFLELKVDPTRYTRKPKKDTSTFIWADPIDWSAGGNISSRTLNVFTRKNPWVRKSNSIVPNKDAKIIETYRDLAEFIEATEAGYVKEMPRGLGAKGVEEITAWFDEFVANHKCVKEPEYDYAISKEDFDKFTNNMINMVKSGMSDKDIQSGIRSALNKMSICIK